MNYELIKQYIELDKYVNTHLTKYSLELLKVCDVEKPIIKKRDVMLDDDTFLEDDNNYIYRLDAHSFFIIVY